MQLRFLMITLLSCFFVHAHSDLVNETFVGREWEFMSYKFQYKLEPKIVVKTVFTSLGLAGLSASVAGFLAQPLRIKSKELMPFMALCGMMSFSLSMVLFHVIFSAVERFDAGIKIVKNWPKYRRYTPENLHTTFDELYRMYQKDGISEQFEKELKKVLKVISRALYYRFPPDYHSFSSTTHMPYVPPA